MAQLAASGVDQDGDPRPVALDERWIGVDVELLERHVKGGQRPRHLLAQMAAGAAVQPQRRLSLYR